MKTLLLMRHAKSDWDADYGSDHDRPLNERGLRSARLMGRVLAEEGLVPDLIISSTAVRARRTAELAVEAGKWGSEILLDRSLYDEGTRGVLAVGASAPDVDGLMLVGHQPTWSMLVSALDRGAGRHEDRRGGRDRAGYRIVGRTSRCLRHLDPGARAEVA